jgi:hypothetical protein
LFVTPAQAGVQAFTLRYLPISLMMPHFRAIVGGRRDSAAPLGGSLMSRLESAAVAALLLACSFPAAAAQEPPAVTVNAPARLVPVSADPDWVEITVTEQARGSYDRNSVRTADGRVHLVARMDFTENRFHIVESFNAWVIDCAGRTWRVAEADMLVEGGDILSYVNTLEDFPWEPVAEDSPVGALHRDYCSSGGQ